ncbi:MAG TPA: PspC domain-containing protein [Spirillospora sp.]
MSEERDTRNEGRGDDRASKGYERLARDADRRVLAGVCTGLGRYTGIDPVVFRIGFAVLVLAHGQGVLLYVAAALLMPASPGESSFAEQIFKRWFDAGAVLTILGALMGAGVVFGVFGGVPNDAIAAVVVFGLVLLVAHSRGVDLVAAARSVPERLSGHPPEPSAEWTRSERVTVGGVALSKDARDPRGDTASRADGGLPEGMIDLAAYSAARGTARLDDGVSAGKGRDAAAVDRHGRSPATAITLLAAMAAAAAMIPLARAYPAPDSWLIVMAPALAVIGLGLIVGGWFRARGLATAGTVLTLAMLTTAVAGGLPRNAEYGAVEWHPVDTARTGRDYKVGVGKGTLDLTALPVDAGQRVTINAEVLFGGLEVRVPSTARVEVDARIALGDLRVGTKTTSGPKVRSTEVLEPEAQTDGPPPVIVLRIRGKIGDVDVLHG